MHKLRLCVIQRSGPAHSAEAHCRWAHHHSHTCCPRPLRIHTVCEFLIVVITFVQVQGAITRQKKEAIVTELTGKLEQSAIVFGLRFKGLDVSCAAASATAFSLFGIVSIPKLQLSLKLVLRLVDHALLLLLLLLHCCQVQTMQKFRRGIPDKSTVYICKNSLMKEAVKQMPNWQTLADTGCSVSISSGVVLAGQTASIINSSTGP